MTLLGWRKADLCSSSVIYSFRMVDLWLLLLFLHIKITSGPGPKPPCGRNTTCSANFCHTSVKKSLVIYFHCGSLLNKGCKCELCKYFQDRILKVVFGHLCQWGGDFFFFLTADSSGFESESATCWPCSLGQIFGNLPEQMLCARFYAAKSWVDKSEQGKPFSKGA